MCLKRPIKAIYDLAFSFAKFVADFRNGFI